MEHGELDVAGVRRTYWLARGPGAGISNGAGFAEHAARHGLLPLTGLFLAAGTIKESSRQVVPVPRQQAAAAITGVIVVYVIIVAIASP
jgi:hypothetical protein